MTRRWTTLACVIVCALSAEVRDLERQLAETAAVDPDRLVEESLAPVRGGVGLLRYDLVWEFVSAICEQRDAIPSFYDGLRAQQVADAVLASHAERVWKEIPDEPR